MTISFWTTCYIFHWSPCNYWWIVSPIKSHWNRNMANKSSPTRKLGPAFWRNCSSCGLIRLHGWDIEHHWRPIICGIFDRKTHLENWYPNSTNIGRKALRMVNEKHAINPRQPRTRRRTIQQTYFDLINGRHSIDSFFISRDLFYPPCYPHSVDHFILLEFWNLLWIY